MKFVKFNGDIVEYNREDMVMNIFLRYLKPLKYFLIKWKAMKNYEKEAKLMKECVDYEYEY